MTAKPSSCNPGAIHAKLLEVMGAIGVVPKDGFNRHDKYEFRRAEDIMNALQPALLAHQVLVYPETLSVDRGSYKTKNGTTMNHVLVDVSYHLVAAEDGSEVVVRVAGEGADVGDKAVNKAHTSAWKTAISQALCLPTESLVDAEGDASHERQEAAHDDTPLTGPATEDDLERLDQALEKRCDELDLDPHSYKPVIIADVLDGTDWTWETVPDIPRKEIGWICSSIEVWEERDNAPGFVDGDRGDAPPQPEERG